LPQVHTPIVNIQGRDDMDIERASKPIVIRRLHTADQPDICAHFQRLDKQSRRARFCGAVSEASSIHYADTIFRDDSIVCGAFVDGILRGIAELRGVFDTHSSTTEAAFSVETDWQNIGIGDALLERIVAISQNRRVEALQMTCMKENYRMAHLAAKHHARLRYDLDGIEATLRPLRPTPLSLTKELLGEVAGHLRAWVVHFVGRGQATG
jgi:ribosomal protein S18 acetylase RimI-like enzyme